MKQILFYFFITILIIILVIGFNFKKKKEYFLSPINKKLKSNVIPKVIVSTYFNKKKIPKKVYNNIKKYAPNYRFLIFDDNDIIIFLKQNYPKKVLETFYSLNQGPHKADLFRYCYLYKFGGIYIDIKTVLIKNIDDILNKKNVDLYTVISRTNYTIHQGVIASVPQNPIFLKLINYIININKPIQSYFAFTIDFYNQMKKIYDKRKLENGYLTDHNGNNSYLFYEICTKNPGDCEDGLDRYNVCCYIYDKGKKIIKTRYSDYPWK
jgi:hypothetical protein